MPSMRKKFPGQPGDELPIELPVEEEAKPRFDPDQFRAFGSVPRLLGSQINVLKFEQLDSRAWEQTSPEILEQGLFGVEGGTAVNGIVLGAEFYEAIIRNHNSFLASVHAKTANANRLGTDPRVQEKLYRSQAASLKNKHERHDKIISGLEDRKETLATLIDMQRTPGYHKRISEVDIRTMATTAWEGVFMGMFHALKDQYDLSNEDMIEMERALSYRLLGGPQADRIENWGKMLKLGSRHTNGMWAMFRQSRNAIEKRQGRIEEELEDFYRTNGISPLGSQAVRHVVEQE